MLLKNLFTIKLYCNVYRTSTPYIFWSRNGMKVHIANWNLIERDVIYYIDLLICLINLWENYKLFCQKKCLMSGLLNVLCTILNIYNWNKRIIITVILIFNWFITGGIVCRISSIFVRIQLNLSKILSVKFSCWMSKFFSYCLLLFFFSNVLPGTYSSYVITTFRKLEAIHQKERRKSIGILRFYIGLKFFAINQVISYSVISDNQLRTYKWVIYITWNCMIYNVDFILVVRQS